MSITVTATLPPSAAALMAADTVLGSWKGGQASLREAAFLIALANNPGKSVMDYAAALGVSRPVITRITDNCTWAGFATRTEDPADRRKVIIRPTTHATRLARVLSGREV